MQHPDPYVPGHGDLAYDVEHATVETVEAGAVHLV